MNDKDGSLEQELAEVFQGEAADLFREIESAVLDLESGSADSDGIHRLFRAVHTLKGSGAMFGLTRLASLAHELESLIEKVRELDSPPDRTLISLVLEVADRLRLLAESTEITEEDDGDLLAKMTAAVVALEDKEEEKLPCETRLISIRFKPFSKIFLSGMDPAMVLDELRAMGDLTVSIDRKELPDFWDFDPEQSYIAFNMTLKTAVSDADIEDVFLFVAEDSELVIQNLSEAEPKEKDIPVPAVARAASSARPGDAPHGESEDIRIAAPRLDSLMNLVGELVMQQARLNELGKVLKVPVLDECLEGLDRISLSLKDCVLNLRMTPIAGIFSRFRRLVRDLCAELEKEVIFEVEGGETELDKALIDGLGEPLVHLVRNSLDHGIEHPGERLKQGKSAAGLLRLSAAALEGRVEICIADDGRGIDREAVLARARERGLVDAGAELGPAEIDSLIFHPGLSTSGVVGKVSGRGVGMDVVRRQIESLAGRITLESRAGQGTRIRMSLPLTLAIVECLMVRVGQGLFALPITQVETCMDFFHEEDSRRPEHLIRFRGKALSYVVLRSFFRMHTMENLQQQVVVVRSETGFFGLVVDSLAGTQQVVIKSMGAWYDRQDGIGGATVMGDGEIAFILDVQGLWRCACTDLVQERDRAYRKNRN
ncbi:chemotaxis protein CheA [Desulfobotulus sp. H1]|uniref:Chemotaxis protein CheA n=1 Tax=Desulfobotulus pelophilus TaxID=2823377 RepID=A0ABT3N9L9_9BACT|nr:chemotaxis protein CheA [Desulfobotulus pelophilus]MCW7754160.1 chemotaxis protein CheA [Desulfobotulus pelophilus]